VKNGRFSGVSLEKKSHGGRSREAVHYAYHERQLSSLGRSGRRRAGAHPGKPGVCPVLAAESIAALPVWPELLESRREWNQTARWCPGIGKGPPIQIELARAQAQEMREAYPAMY
jgi:hypothetical protein